MSKMLEKVRMMNPVVTSRYLGDVFTVVQVELQVGSNGNGKPKMVRAEGIARRSFVDKPNEDLGFEIARGRALRALTRKITTGRPVRHRYMG